MDGAGSNTSLLIGAEKKSIFSDQNHINRNLESVALSLALVLLLIFILAWFVKRFAPAGISVNQKQMRILSVLPLGGRDKLMLIDIYGTQMVVASGSSGVNCLHVFSEPVCSDNQPEDNKFQGVLQQFMKDRAKNRDQD
ncbi:flagellar biosynthetic protein FliO [Oceanospirillum sp. D5]|uniref:Flagellar protein n=1 Tax=Oceanospirillum sediminis TaxID=2760088 RepID=A0A839IJZ2_9GAMM|nr:flagellar biosynthetic protein FliO [Oceanospirillum sediminis]